MQNDTRLTPGAAGANQFKPEEGIVNLQPIDWIQIIAFVSFGLTIAFFAGFFRRKSIAGPRRLYYDRATAAELMIPALAGFSAYLFAPAAYILLAVGPHHQQLSPHQTVCTYAISAAAGLIAIQLLDVAQGKRSLPRRDLPAGIFFGVIGALAVIPLVLATTLIVQEAMRRAGAAAPEEHPLLVVFQQRAAFDRLLVILSAVILAPLFEELLFRAHLQAAIRRATGHPWLAVITASALFALVHQFGWMMPPLLVLAIGLGYVYERTRNIWANILMHSLFNALSLTVEYLSMKHH